MRFEALLLASVIALTDISGSTAGISFFRSATPVQTIIEETNKKITELITQSVKQQPLISNEDKDLTKQEDNIKLYLKGPLDDSYKNTLDAYVTELNDDKLLLGSLINNLDDLSSEASGIIDAFEEEAKKKLNSGEVEDEEQDDLVKQLWDGGIWDGQQLNTIIFGEGTANSDGAIVYYHGEKVNGVWSGSTTSGLTDWKMDLATMKSHHSQTTAYQTEHYGSVSNTFRSTRMIPNIYDKLTVQWTNNSGNPGYSGGWGSILGRSTCTVNLKDSDGNTIYSKSVDGKNYGNHIYSSGAWGLTNTVDFDLTEANKSNDKYYLEIVYFESCYTNVGGWLSGEINNIYFSEENGNRTIIDGVEVSPAYLNELLND